MTETAEITYDGGLPVIQVRGKITLGPNCARLRQAVEQLLEQGKVQILVNMEEAAYVDSAGLGVIASCYVKTRAVGGSLSLFRVSSTVLELLELTQLNEKIPIFPDQPTAIAGVTQLTPKG